MGWFEKAANSMTGGKAIYGKASGRGNQPGAKPVIASALSVAMLACLFSLVMIQAVQAADPGHPASSVSAGTFEAGDFAFPQNLTAAKFFIANGTTLYVDAINGRVGIGTANPSAKLHVSGGNLDLDANKSVRTYPASVGGFAMGVSMWSADTSTASDAYGRPGFVGRNLYWNGTEFVAASTNAGSNWGTVTGMMATNADVRFLTRAASESGLDYGLGTNLDSITRMAITTGGNVGIGTTSPANKLEVAGDVNASSGSMIFYNELMPDGATCGDGEILKRTGSNNWDCASDSGLASESDPVWSGNYTACTSSQKLYFNGRSLACANDNDTNTYNTTEEMQDAAGGLLGGTETGISVTYDDANNDVDFVVSESDPRWSGNVTACASTSKLYFSGNSLACTTETGDIESITTATTSGISGGCASGTCTLTLNSTCTSGQILESQGSGVWACGADDSGGGGAGWATSGNYVYNDTAGALVGIGTASPTDVLTVNLSSDLSKNVTLLLANGQTLKLMSNGAGGAARISASNALVLQSSALVYFSNTTGSYNSVIASDGSQNSYLAAYGGNVGIGTSTANERLNVSGNITISNTIKSSTGDVVIQLG